jgi:competence protein ComEA
VELDDLVHESKIIENNVDIKPELLDFRETKIRVNNNNAAESGFIPVNVNNAGIDELTKLPGIGIKTAEAIVQYRNKFGKFNSVEDLLNVKGIGNSKLETIKDKIIVK